ncbi:MAG: hypothetical protein HN584_14230 [Akkermansiaceae bacterium]|nr:hypothetical protein [Akkermansiaceae bacterium]
MAKHLKLDTTDVLDKRSGNYDETGNTIETTQIMRNFHSATEMPAHALKPGSIVPFR